MKKQSLDIQHIDFYRTHGALVVEQVIPLPIFNEAKKEAVFIKELSLRNVWKKLPIYKKIFLSKSLHDQLYTLTRQNPLRFGYDHFFSSIEELKQFFPKDTSIAQKSSIDGLEIALLINLSNEISTLESQTHLFPYIGCSGCWINPRRHLDFSDLIDPKGPFLLLTFCKHKARYIHQAEDPFTHDEKKQGLVFGDILHSEQHPSLFVH